MAVKHAFVSAKAQGADPTQASANEWNADHTINGVVSATPVIQNPIAPQAIAGQPLTLGSGSPLIQSPTVVTFSSTPTFNAALGNAFKLTLTGAVTSSTLANATAGQFLLFQIIQDATGGRTFVWPTNVKGAMPIDTTANRVNVQLFYFDGTFAYPVAPGTQT